MQTFFSASNKQTNILRDFSDRHAIDADLANIQVVSIVGMRKIFRHKIALVRLIIEQILKT